MGVGDLGEAVGGFGGAVGEAGGGEVALDEVVLAFAEGGAAGVEFEGAVELEEVFVVDGCGAGEGFRPSGVQGQCGFFGGCCVLPSLQVVVRSREVVLGICRVIGCEVLAEDRECGLKGGYSCEKVFVAFRRSAAQS